MSTVAPRVSFFFFPLSKKIGRGYMLKQCFSVGMGWLLPFPIWEYIYYHLEKSPSFVQKLIDSFFERT